jgi:acyl carrier protein
MNDWTSEFEAILRGHLPLLGQEAIEPADRLVDLGLDSLATVSLLLDLEAAFSVTIPDEMLTAETFATASALWSVVSSPDGGRVAS